ncbi:MAG: gliding motility-associated C-terminal domain-containing protein [Bacteroidetes bacterium]|nr:gliding motility-associated C-terminal domain-containing protein [Bacteroidota bacterium]
MKKRLHHFFFLFTLWQLCFPSTLFSQQKLDADSPEYEQAKQAKIALFRQQHLFETHPTDTEAKLDSTTDFFRSCKELIAVDSSFLIVPFDTSSFVHAPQYRNDDKSTQAIPLPFNFCFYGQDYDSVFINNNGSISFDYPTATFIPDSFPTNYYKMIAPFWADVDTRNLQSGLVYYKITPTHLIVTWDHVGYYASHADKKNTFQLIITDGMDTLLRPGKNVSFRYDEMEWSTGDIGGIGGFTDPAATIGANFGDSIKFIQFGRFAQPGSFYDGPYGSWDGISWLNGRVFEFSVCASDNIEPIVNNFNYCDTLYSCVGDTINLDLSFLSPEFDQITSCNIVASNPSGLTVTENSAGAVNTIKAKYIGNFSNVGIQNIVFTATDNGSPPAFIQLKINLKINPFYDSISVMGAVQNICPNTTALLTATSGFDKYKWSNNFTTASINAPPGDYYVIGKRGNCYISSDTVSIGAYQTTIPIISGNDTTVICKADSTLFQVIGNYPHYLWSNGDTTQAAFLQPGFVQVQTTDSNGCKVKSAGTNIPGLPSYPVSISGIKVICPEDSITLHADPGFLSYVWSTGSIDTSITVPIGNYFLIGLDSNNCKNYSPLLTVPFYAVNVPVVNGFQHYCTGDSVELSFAPAASNFYWNTSDTLSSIYVKNGDYFVTIIDSNQCAVPSLSLHVEAFPIQPLLINGSLGYCPGDSSLLTASAGFTNYMWSFGDSLPSVYVQAGNYSITAIDSNACLSSSALVQIAPYLVSAPSILGNLMVCPSDSTLLQASAGFSSYSWSTGDSSISINVPQGVYTVLVRDSNSCVTQSNPVSVQNYAVQQPIISGNTFCCYNDSSLLSASPGFVHYSWSSGDTTMSAMQTPGIYFVEVLDSNNCKTASLNGFVLSSFPMNWPTIYGYDYYCKGDSVKLFVNYTYPHYLWSNGAVDSITYVQTGNYSALVTDVHNCVYQSNSVLIQQFPEHVPQISGKHFYCEGDSILLQAEPGFSQVMWSNGVAANAIYAQSGTYSLTANDSNNCLSYALPHSVAPSIPKAEILGEQYICDSDSVYLQVSNSFAHYAWSNGSQLPAIYALNGAYSVQIRDSIGCQDEDSLFISAYPLPKAHFSFSPLEVEANENVQFINNSAAGSSNLIGHSWSIKNTTIFSTQNNPQYVFPDSGYFEIELHVKDANGCSDSYSEIIHVIKSIKIPNIITPNGDGENDVFEIVNLNLASPTVFAVYDRWGNKSIRVISIKMIGKLIMRMTEYIILH